MIAYRVALVDHSSDYHPFPVIDSPPVKKECRLNLFFFQDIQGINGGAGKFHADWEICGGAVIEGQVDRERDRFDNGFGPKRNGPLVKGKSAKRCRAEKFQEVAAMHRNPIDPLLLYPPPLDPESVDQG
jgi:hypothetical protein